MRSAGHLVLTLVPLSKMSHRPVSSTASWGILKDSPVIATGSIAGFWASIMAQTSFSAVTAVSRANYQDTAAIGKVEAVRPSTILSGIASMTLFLPTLIVKNNQQTRPWDRCNGRVSKLGSITHVRRVSPAVVSFLPITLTPCHTVTRWPPLSGKEQYHNNSKFQQIYFIY